MPNGISWFMGAARDGVGVERLKNYRHDLETQDGADPDGLAEDEFAPFNIWPSLYLDPDLLAPENAGILQALVDSIKILNDACPRSSKWWWRAPAPRAAQAGVK